MSLPRPTVAAVHSVFWTDGSSSHQVDAASGRGKPRPQQGAGRTLDSFLKAAGGVHFVVRRLDVTATTARGSRGRSSKREVVGTKMLAIEEKNLSTGYFSKKKNARTMCEVHGKKVSRKSQDGGDELRCEKRGSSVTTDGDYR
ncbi:hypothetical protein PsorP6_011438 [Peronosclerospora sorghi]|uniref:Uncharacterized protein n=1 Tax=Peronosclerospora sorghi TaxID=230839 RepID=A0ACC0WIX0_9STRA|nr:hypothetical protein PsorP6_011438 [Peronosclerospora sorghi]